MPVKMTKKIRLESRMRKASGKDKTLTECLSKRVVNALTYESKRVSDYSHERVYSKKRKLIDGKQINTLGDLSSLTWLDLLRLPNFGKTSLEEVRRVLAMHGLKLKEDKDAPH